MGAHGSIVGWSIILQAIRSWVWNLMRALNFLVYLILPSALATGVYLASNRNEYQNEKKNVYGE
jgi:hypothetical protein